MGLLDKYQKNNIRFQYDDLILYEPNAEQMQQLKDFLSNKVEVDEEFNINQEILFSQIRWVIREMTSIGYEIDEYTDEELQEKLNNGTEGLQLLLNAISDLFTYVVESLYQDYITQIKQILDLIEVGKKNQQIEDMKTEVIDKLQSVGINIDQPTIIKAEELRERIKEEAKKEKAEKGKEKSKTTKKSAGTKKKKVEKEEKTKTE